MTDLDSLIRSVKERLHISQLWDDKGNLVGDEFDKFNEKLKLSLRFADNISTLPGVSTDTSFKWRDVEPLLEQANALLDRAIADRTVLQSVGEKWATLLLDIIRSINLIKITDRERAAKPFGRFETPFIVSSNQCDAQNLIANGLTRQAAFHMNASKIVSANKDIQIDRSAWEESAALADKDGGNIKAWLGEAPPDADIGAHNARENIAAATARRRLRVEADTELNLLAAEDATISAQVDAAQKTLAGLQAQMAWDQKNQEFMGARADLDRYLLMLKIFLVKVDWMLDFEQQFSSVRSRYNQSLRDAYDRLRVVQTGLWLLYGFSRKQRDGSPDLLPDLRDEVKSHDDIIAWTRRATTWLAATTRRCNNYVAPISVKSAPESHSSIEIRDREWSFKFKLGPDMFPDPRVRIRGIAAWIVGGGDDRLWTVSMTLPNRTQIIDEGGHPVQSLDPDGNKSEWYNQGDIRCRISNVTKRSLDRNTEIAGIASCFNASPIGEWTVRLEDAFGQASVFGEPDDVQIDLYLSVIPKDLKSFPPPGKPGD
ncbi:MAG: hypothetical protein ABSD31_10535 [Candidatus Binataceae bacterium]